MRMKKNVCILLVLTLLTLFGNQVFAQVTIGDLRPPRASSIFEVVSLKNDKGVLIPAMTEDQMRKIDNPANGLLVYNTTENCFNYYDETDWISLCGGVMKSDATANCSDVTVYGSYIEGTSLNSSNYLVMNINVSRPGAYEISATTTNGYGFNASGTFLNKGLQQVTLVGQGIPTSVSGGDVVSITINGSAANYTCVSPASPVVIQVTSANPTFSMNCSTVKANGTYSKGVSLTNTNTITMQVDVSDVGNGQWKASTDVVDGISFSGNGVFLANGSYTITLNGYGIPATNDKKTMTINLNSKGVSKVCTATVDPTIPPMTVLMLGNADNWGIWGGDGYMSHRMLYDKKNFGTQAVSTVKFGDGTNTWQRHASSGTPSSATAQTALSSATPPDIVTIAYGYYPDAALATALVNYLQAGGVVIMFCEDGATNQYMLRALFNNTSMTSTDNGGTGLRHQFITPSSTNDPVMKGPFGDLTGLYWGEDLASTDQISGLTAGNMSQITVYSSNTAGNPIMFRHNSLNFIWCGDGGFNAGGGSATTASGDDPLYIDSNNLPQPRNYGSAAPYGLVYNSQFTANAMAWALQKAMDTHLSK
jgi:hypothetical protein